MTEASETTKWSLEADNIQCVLMHVCLYSELSLFLKVFVHIAGRGAALCVPMQYMCVCLGGVFGPLVHLCVHPYVFHHVRDMTGANADSVWRWWCLKAPGNLPGANDIHWS